MFENYYALSSNERLPLERFSIVYQNVHKVDAM